MAHPSYLEVSRRDKCKPDSERLERGKEEAGAQGQEGASEWRRYLPLLPAARPIPRVPDREVELGRWENLPRLF